MLARSVGLQAILPSQAKHSRVAPLPLTLARPIIPSNRNLFDTDIIKSFNIIVRSFSSPSSYSKSPKISKKEKKSSTGGNQSTTTGKQRILSTSTTAAATLLGGTAAYATMSSQENNAESVTKESKGEQETKVVLVSAAFQIPHPEKKHKGGEDTLFVSSSGSVVGVFDGMIQNSSFSKLQLAVLKLNSPSENQQHNRATNFFHTFHHSFPPSFKYYNSWVCVTNYRINFLIFYISIYYV